MKNISFMEQLLYFFLDVLIVVASLNMTELFNKLVASYKKMNENVKMKYVDAQSYVTNYWREIKQKPEFEQIDNDKILEWNNKSLKRKSSLLLYWGNIAFATNDMREG